MPATAPLRHLKECRKGKCNTGEIPHATLRKSLCIFEEKVLAKNTLTYMDFPTQHWTRLRTNNAIERLNREIKRRTKAIGAFPDGQSALMLVCARLRHVAATSWGSRRYMNMDHLFNPEEDQLSDIIAG